MDGTRQTKRLKTEHKEEEDGGGCFSVPDFDCTRHNFFQEHPHLNDRQRICWALQTEERVRFGKLLKRNDFSRYPGSLGSCPHLIDLYPIPTASDDNDGFGIPEKDWLDYQRKAVPGSMNMREIDESVHPCRVDVGSTRRMSELHVNHNVYSSSCAVPPNFLFFRIILEGFMGYNVLDEMANNGDLWPRWAVMGGAVVASLTAWRNARVHNWIVHFEGENLLQKSTNYSQKKRELIHQINSHFMHNTFDDGEPAPDGSLSPMFSDGDVDVFLQASPLTKTVQHRITALPRDVLKKISEYLGGCGFVSSDLQAFSKMLCNKLNATVDEDENAFVYSLTKNGLSFMLTLYEEEGWDTKLDWPRCTQIIIMNEQADLLGGLMDFDISLATCAFDGNSVYLTPRAMISIQTCTQIVTPFVVQERRNRERVIKYFKRGFVPYLLDPNCHRYGPCQIPTTGESLQNQPTHEEVISNIETPHWRARELHPHYNPIFPDELVQACCIVQELGKDRRWTRDRIGRRGTNPFSLYLFEREEDHAIQFFSNQFGWTPQDHETVRNFSKESRVACRHCRELYAATLFMEEGPLEPLETGDDVIHGDYAFTKGVVSGNLNHYEVSFYSGGTFDCKRVGANARTIHSQLSALSAQHMAEEARYAAAIARGRATESPYKCRFIFSEDLGYLFRWMEKTRFAPNSRQPVGLNPERFIGVCASCQGWLLGYEYGTRYCLKCSER